MVAVERINQLMGDSTWKADRAVQELVVELRLAGYSLPDLIAVVEDRYKKIGQDPERRQWMAPTTIFKDKLFSKYMGKVGMREPKLGPLKPKDQSTGRNQRWKRRGQEGYYSGKR